MPCTYGMSILLPSCFSSWRPQYETLRLYPPVVFIPRYTGTQSATLKLKGKEYTLPPKTDIIISIGSLNTTPKLWGTDSLSFRPDRWISQTRGSKAVEHEELKPLPIGFLPWSVGPRSCPGKKFAQVEFVAVIAHLFRRHCVKAVSEPGETMEAVKKRLFEIIEDSALEVTIKMNHPEKAQLVWEERAWLKAAMKVPIELFYADVFILVDSKFRMGMHNVFWRVAEDAAIKSHHSI